MRKALFSTSLSRRRGDKLELWNLIEFFVKGGWKRLRVWQHYYRNLMMYSGKTREDWERLEQATFFYKRALWMAFTNIKCYAWTYILQEWTNEWIKDQFFQVNVSSLANCNLQFLNFFSKWLPPWDNQLPRQWCARQKPKQVRRPSSCWQLYELTQMKLKSRPVRVGAHPDWLV